MDELIKRHDWWERHEGFDLWSIPHVLYGAAMGFVPFFVPFISWPVGFVLTLIFAILWEVGEKIFKIKESTQNIYLDILISGVGYLATVLAVQKFSLTGNGLWTAFISVAFLGAFMGFMGWKAHRRRMRQKSR